MTTRAMLVPYADPAAPNDRDCGLVYLPLEGRADEQMTWERFDSESWADLPDRVRVTRGHRRDDPLGWAAVENTPAGLVGMINWAGSNAGRDAEHEVRRELMTSFSISFAMDSGRMSVHRGLPMLLHRGAKLIEVGLVSRPAYRNAKVIEADVDAENHARSERILAPARLQRDREVAERRARSAELMSWDPGPPPIPLREPVDLGRIGPATDDRVLVRRGMGMPW